VCHGREATEDALSPFKQKGATVRVVVYLILIVTRTEKRPRRTKKVEIRARLASSKGREMKRERAAWKNKKLRVPNPS
jgi:hypothetical protein